MRSKESGLVARDLATLDRRNQHLLLSQCRYAETVIGAPKANGDTRILYTKPTSRYRTLSFVQVEDVAIIFVFTTSRRRDGIKGI